MKKKYLIVGIISILFLTIGASYAYFTSMVIGSGAPITVKAKKLAIIFTDTSEITGTMINPGWEETKTFTVENKSGGVFYYDINIDNLVNTFVTEGYLQYKITSADGGYNMTDYMDVPTSEEAKKVVLASDIEIEPEKLHTYVVEFRYLISLEDQSADMGKTFSGSLSITESDIYMEKILAGANPEIKPGMIPVKIENDGTVKKADLTSKWYSYKDKEWANAVLVSESTRSNYMNAEANTIIKEEDILVYLVWIPRYKYRLWYVEVEDKLTELDTSKVHSIDIVFESKDTKKSNGNKNGEFLTHPSFTFGSEELNGIWVGKFETGNSGNSNTDSIIVKPNALSWHRINYSDMFYSVRGMNTTNTFGLDNTTDAHPMKSTDWGAVAYLSHSKFGINGIIYNNNNYNKNTYTTGCGGDISKETITTTCKNAYGSKTDGIYNQSTTGNITGIFDMSGGTWEQVMGYVSQYGSSGFTDETFPESKYVDKYSSTSGTDYSKRILGDATGELGPMNIGIDNIQNNSWYASYASMVVPNRWDARGGNTAGNLSTSNIFSFSENSGGAINGIGFRIVII